MIGYFSYIHQLCYLISWTLLNNIKINIHKNKNRLIVFYMLKKSPHISSSSSSTAQWSIEDMSRHLSKPFHFFLSKVQSTVAFLFMNLILFFTVFFTWFFVYQVIFSCLFLLSEHSLLHPYLFSIHVPTTPFIFSICEYIGFAV